MSENKQLCAECEGRCCKQMPGIYHPDDLRSLHVRSIATQLKSGKWALDWWEGEPREYYLRPATKTGRRIYDPSWGGECIFLTACECELEHDDRPRGCRDLEASAGDHCPGPDKRDGADWWAKHQRMLRAAGKMARQSIETKAESTLQTEDICAAITKDEICGGAYRRDCDR